MQMNLSSLKYLQVVRSQFNIRKTVILTQPRHWESKGLGELLKYCILAHPACAGSCFAGNAVSGQVV